MKKMMIGAAACALLFSSCSQNEVSDFTPSGSNAINFTSTTSRASINDLSAMQADAAGFKVYASSGAAPAAWFTGIDGTNNYKYGTSWGWATTTPTAPQWPAVATGYPMNFYACYPATHASYVTFNTTAGTTPIVSSEITIQGTAAAQADLLAAKASTSTKPGDGFLPMTFQHILSKINFGIIAGTGTTVYVQSIAVKNVLSTNTYNYVSQVWGTTATVLADYSYFSNTATPFKPTTADETTANAIYTAPHTNHLMLMPQTNTTTWTPVSGTAPIATSGAYIEVVYRIETIGNPDNVGYGTAPNHPDYATLGNGETKLFVKVGFPLSATSFTWDPAKGYTYNIKLGTTDATGGYYTDDTYTDQDGNDTALPIDPNKKPGDPVASGTINFRLVVAPWTDQTATP